MNIVTLPRRRFLAVALSSAGGLAVGFGRTAEAAGALPASVESEAVPSSAPSPALGPGSELSAWLVIEPDDTVVIRVSKSEMGQGIFTSLPMIVAEELGCDWASVRAEYASANRNRREGDVYGRMGTGGSTSVRTLHFTLQRVGASARARLIEAAAEAWGVAPSTCRVANGAVIEGAGGRSARFGALAARAATITLAAEPRIKEPSEYTLIGTRVKRLDTPPKTRGAARFGIDTRLPGMLYAAISTPPVFGARLLHYDSAAVLSRRGIKAVVPVGGGVAVVADSFWRAKEALAAMTIAWSAGDTEGSGELTAAHRAALDGPGVTAFARGDAPAALAAAPATVDATYEVPYLAHATMEPLNCTAYVQPDRVDVWIGTQNPDLALVRAAGAAGLPAEKAFIHNAYLGGGFGRRGTNDELPQAVAISKAVGAPVKLVWTREDDIRHDRFRPQAAIRMQAALRPDGLPHAWEMRTAVDSIDASLFGMRPAAGYEFQAIEGLDDISYAVANLRVGCALQETPVPVMFWRSVGYSQNAFAVESFIDEMAHAASADPLDFRRRLLAHRPDFLGVLDVLAAKGDWGKPLPDGHGRGIAISQSHDTIVGEIAEVAVSAAGSVRVERVVVAVDCGHAINPHILETQIESAVVYGLTAALYGEITIDKGRVVQGNFDTYPMMRMEDCPRIETHLALSGGSRWGGIGEPATPPAGPAVCNAVFAATGQRIRALPLRNATLRGRA
ncbi:MAG TPA: molybdopterin cofactor-binding domain-containing protein [Acetobacteraceae bacterium]|nr:molybdopterin cofactor-binding domain-containing protein [Acetobacteraceae bacterium]